LKKTFFLDPKAILQTLNAKAEETAKNKPYFLINVSYNQIWLLSTAWENQVVKIVVPKKVFNFKLLIILLYNFSEKKLLIS
jgi:hypothetical protein